MSECRIKQILLLKKYDEDDLFLTNKLINYLLSSMTRRQFNKNVKQLKSSMYFRYQKWYLLDSEMDFTIPILYS